MMTLRYYITLMAVSLPLLAQVEELGTLEVRAPADPFTLSREELAGAWGNLGELLESLPGLHNRAVGPDAGRPVVRGHGDHRLTILQGLLEVGDVSAASDDHALGLSTAGLEEVRVVRGVETLLYGSGLSGGLLLTSDRLLPEESPPFELGGGYRYRSVSDAHSADLYATFTEADPAPLRRLLHNVKRAEPLWLSLLASGSWHGDLETGRSRLDNTSGRRREGGVGLGLGERLGMSYRFLDRRYGLPGEEEGATIPLVRHRLQLRARPFRQLQLSFGWTGYRHREEEGGEVASRWRRRGVEGRLEWEGAGWRLGLQGGRSLIRVEGREAELPATEQRRLALFFQGEGPSWLQSFLRLEHVATGSRRDLLPSGGFRIALSRRAGRVLSLDLFTSARAPSPEERFLSGFHAALGGFQEGRRKLHPERFLHLELDGHLSRGPLFFDGALFYQRFFNYLFWERAGEEEGLPLWRIGQGEAHFAGFEASLGYGGERFALTLFGDYSRGWLDGGAPVPRMPPLRYGLRVDLFPGSNGHLELRLTRSRRQNRAGRGEEETPAFLKLDLVGRLRLPLSRGELLLFAAAENLLDQTVIPATAFRKLPQGGRGFSVGVELSF